MNLDDKSAQELFDLLNQEYKNIIDNTKRQWLIISIITFLAGFLIGYFL